MIIYIYKQILFIICMSGFFCCTHSQIALTIMTAPIGKTGYGHARVTESLLRGLNQLGIAYIHNPTTVAQVTDIVVVLADPQALQQAISLKKKGRIKRLVAGPNIMVRSDEYGGILGASEVDICIVPSPWVATAYEEDMPTLKERIRVWYAGVDTEYWKTLEEHAVTNTHVLIYWKTESESFVISIESLVRSYGFIPVRIRYGEYTASEYKTLLSHCIFAIFISRSESQGIALAEAWSMNIPTFVWNPQELQAYGRIYSEVSACPYLSEQTGYTWKHTEELRSILESVLPRCYFSPRKWVMQYMTYSVSARMLLDIINNL